MGFPTISTRKHGRGLAGLIFNRRPPSKCKIVQFVWGMFDLSNHRCVILKCVVPNMGDPLLKLVCVTNVVSHACSVNFFLVISVGSNWLNLLFIILLTRFFLCLWPALPPPPRGARGRSPVLLQWHQGVNLGRVPPPPQGQGGKNGQHLVPPQGHPKQSSRVRPG